MKNGTPKMGYKKPATKKPEAAKPQNTSTSPKEPVSIPTKGGKNDGGIEKPYESLKYKPGLVSKTYDLTPQWDRHQIVEILWVDAIANAITEWMDLEDLENTQPCETLSVGYLLKDHPEWITIIALLNDGSAGHAITIPRGMILKITPLHR